MRLALLIFGVGLLVILFTIRHFSVQQIEDSVENSVEIEDCK